MKKSKSKRKPGKTAADHWSPFPQNNDDWTDEDRALEWLVRGMRVSPRSAANPLPPCLTVPAMNRFFEWLCMEVTEKENPDAVEKIYHLTLLAVRNLHEVCESRPDLFRPIARQQLFWPSMAGRGAYVERTNRELMELLNMGEAAPLNTARNGRKSFSILEGGATRIACSLWCAIEYFRREEQGVYGGAHLCSLVMPGLPDFYSARKLGLNDAQIEKLKTLLPLSRQNFVEWWELGEPAFVQHHGTDFENHKDFSGYWKNNAFKDDLKARAKIRSAIKKQIKQAFRSIAPKASTVDKSAPTSTR